MSTDVRIEAHGLSKKFSTSLRRSMHYGLKDSLRRLVGLPVPSGQVREGEFWAVDNVTFALNKGESLGIMGVNGSGKTTLLRILNGTYAPDAGQVTMRGKVGALIAAGAGFSPVLTGRENVYVNGALLGMGRREIDRRMEEIIRFAEIDNFIDSPVRHYSSGMQVRLGFAIAAMSEPEVLLVDEVLAVGDMNFQKKCYDYLHRLKRNGTAIVLVSHSIGAIWALCDRGLYLHKGKVEVAGPIEEVLRADKDGNDMAVTPAAQPAPAAGGLAANYGGQQGGTGDVIVHQTRALDLETGLPRAELAFGEGFVLESEIEVRAPIPQPIIRYNIDAAHYRFIVVLDSHESGHQPAELLPGTYRVRARVPRQNLMPSTYMIAVSALQRSLGVHLYYCFDVCRIKVRQPEGRLLKANDTAVLHLENSFDIAPIEALRKSADAPGGPQGC